MICASSIAIKILTVGAGNFSECSIAKAFMRVRQVDLTERSAEDSEKSLDAAIY